MATVIRGDDNFDTANADPDVSPNAWHRYLLVSTEYTSVATLDFGGSVHTGSNLTEAGGKITVSVAGMYLISFQGSRYSSVDTGWDWTLTVNSTELSGTRAYVSGNNVGSYDSTGMTIPVQLAAGDTVFMQGTGHLHGSPGGNSMTSFTGVRLGA
tara:strand:- start:24 stop:488 length:465 start_codon:yes stop_codon:yes gene_type:complete